MTLVGGPPDATRPGLRVAMALYGDISFDSRVQREAQALSRAGHAVTVFCLSGSAPDASFKVVTHRPTGTAVLPDGTSPFLGAGRSRSLAGLMARGRWVRGYTKTIRAWGTWATAAAGEVDVWHAHDLTGLLAVGPRVKDPTVLVYDSHEIFMETGTAARLPGPFRRLLAAYEKRLARRAVALVTVNEDYAAVLGRRLQPRRTVLVRNCPPRWEPPPLDLSPLRASLALPLSSPLILYHGGFAANRGIDQLAEAIVSPGLESTHLALLGFGEDRERLTQVIDDPRFEGRIHLLDAVPPGELLAWVAGAEVDVIALQRSSLNHWFCTPNKLWESLAAGVPVVVSDFPTMRRIVLEDPAGPLGAVCDPADPMSIASAITSLINLIPTERLALRERCLRAAHDRWNWEQESSRLVALYSEMKPVD